MSEKRLEIIINSANANANESSKSKRRRSFPIQDSALPGEHRATPYPGRTLPPASPTKCIPPFPPETECANNCNLDISSTPSLKTNGDASNIDKDLLFFKACKKHNELN